MHLKQNVSNEFLKYKDTKAKLNSGLKAVSETKRVSYVPNNVCIKCHMLAFPKQNLRDKQKHIKGKS